MSSFQYKFEKKKLDQSNAILEHYFGDLWIRDDVCFQDDLDKAFDNDIEPIIIGMSDITSFNWKFIYTIPYLDQIKDKSKKEYEMEDQNYHCIEIIKYENHKLFLCSDLIFNPPELIIKLINKFKGVKVLYIDCANVNEGFLETDPDNDDYICKTLNNPNWFVNHLAVPNDDSTDLDDLKIIKKGIDPSIKIDLNCPELEKKLS